MLAEDNRHAGEPFSPAPLTRRIGANLVDSGLGLLVIYLSTLPIQFAYDHGFGDFYLAICQSFVIGWALLKDSWWPGRSLGKKVARIRVTMAGTGQSATRLRCVGRQAIFAALLAAITLPTYFYSFQSTLLARQAILSAVLSATAPIRVLTVLRPGQTEFFGPGNIPLLGMLAFILIEAILVYARSDRRRIVDLLAGTKVVDDRGALPS